jgi:aspartate kinase
MNDLSQPNQGAASSRLECVVMKFGGTSLEDAAAIRRACRLVTRRAPLRPTVVVSALAGVTDQLMHMGWAAAEGRPGFARESLQQLRQRHQAVAGGLIAGEPCNRLGREFEAQCMEIEKAVSSIAAEKAFTPQSQDRLLGVGESLSSKLVHAALRSAGVDAAWVDARECIITDAAHTRATPLWLETEQRLDAVVRPLLESGRIPVMGGFVGATRDGIATTLGRGGSDFSAALVGAGLHARRIEIWTDVDGIMTTDPNLCSEARRVARMSFEEAAELAFFGAKVLHPATLAPAMGRNVPVWVLNARNPECPGTEIVTRSAGVHDADASQVKAITSRRGLAIVDVEAVRWFAPELLREVFEVFERHQHSLDLLSASRGSLALVVSSVTALPAIA